MPSAHGGLACGSAAAGGADSDAAGEGQEQAGADAGSADAIALAPGASAEVSGHAPPGAFPCPQPPIIVAAGPIRRPVTHVSKASRARRGSLELAREGAFA